MTRTQSDTGRELLPVAARRQSWLWLGGQLALRRRDVVLTSFVAVLAAAATVTPVYVLGSLVDKVAQGAPTSAIVAVAVIIAVAALLGGTASGLSSYRINRLGETVLATLRESVMARALTLPTATIERAGKGDLLSRVGSDVEAVGKAVSAVIPVVVSGLLLGGTSLVAMAGLDWRLGLAGAVAVPMYVLALRWYLPPSAPRYRLEREAIAARSQILVESMHGIRTVHAYRLEDRHFREVDAASATARDISVTVFTFFTRFVGRVNRAEFTGLSVILITGFLLVQTDQVTVGQTTAAALLFTRLFNPVGAMMYMFDEVQTAGASLDRLVGVANIPKPVEDAVLLVEEEDSPADLVLTDVSFGYGDGPDVLHGVSIRVAASTRVAVVGSSGAGKTTVAALAAGTITPRSGTATLGGDDLASLRPDCRASRIALVTQEVHVFAGPLVEDLRLASPDASLAEITSALASVGASRWVDALPLGVDTIVGEGGHDLTAGQAQQLALARVELRNPMLVILDEATAEAGSSGARDLEQSAAAVTRGRTTLIVAHRLTQAAAADRIVVLDHGRVVEEGTHQALMKNAGRYAELWSAWESAASTHFDKPIYDTDEVTKVDGIRRLT